jgi:MFS superfamily sulfate permease-like transporter
MVGIIQLIMSFLKLGALVELISQPVIHGFISAAAINIVVPQLSGLLAIKTRRDFIGCLTDVFSQIKLWQYTDILVGLTGFSMTLRPGFVPIITMCS